ncbi:LacI family DNA-binding transcriptional regulator [Vibrio mediterranei]|nr:LacI family DNA-binding transcriptional regulator [Vibrio mediterranei]
MAKSTISDVARRANVSIATVSRYLNKSSFITNDKVRAIEEAIFELGYKKSAKSKKNHAERKMRIGVVGYAFHDLWVSQLLSGINEEVKKRKHTISLETSLATNPKDLMNLKILSDNDIDGFIFLGGSFSDDIGHIDSEIPILLVGHDNMINNWPTINIDNELGGYIATNYVIQNGHKVIAHICGPQHLKDGRDRLLGYKRALKTAGIAFDSTLVVDGYYETKHGLWQAQALLKNRPDITAIFCANDLCAFGAIQGLHQIGYKVPDDVSIVGFDDMLMADVFIPRLTTIRQPSFELGELAIKMLFDIIDGRKLDHKVPKVTLVERDSVRPNEAPTMPPSVTHFRLS